MAIIGVGVAGRASGRGAKEEDEAVSKVRPMQLISSVSRPH